MKYPIGIQSFAQIREDHYAGINREDLFPQPSEAVREKPACVHPEELFLR